MKKDKITWYSTIGIDFLSTAVLVIVCDDKDTLIDTAKTIDKDLNTENLVQEAVKVLTEENYLCSSTLKAPSGAEDVIVFFNAASPDRVEYETMVHEFHHAVSFLCDSRGIEDEETEAYLQEHLFHKMLCKIDDWLDKQKKVSKKPKKKA